MNIIGNAEGSTAQVWRIACQLQKLMLLNICNTTVKDCSRNPFKEDWSEKPGTKGNGIEVLKVGLANTSNMANRIFTE